MNFLDNNDSKEASQRQLLAWYLDTFKTAKKNRLLSIPWFVLRISRIVWRLYACVICNCQLNKHRDFQSWWPSCPSPAIQWKHLRQISQNPNHCEFKQYLKTRLSMKLLVLVFWTCSSLAGVVVQQNDVEEYASSRYRTWMHNMCAKDCPSMAMRHENFSGSRFMRGG